MEFTIDGVVHKPGADPARVKKAKAALDALPLGKLWTLEKVAEALCLSLHQANEHTRRFFDGYRAKTGTRYLYGSRRTIALWQKEQAKRTSIKS